MKRGALAVALVAAALALSACGERGEPLGVDVSPYPVTVRGTDNRPVTLAASPTRIVALSRGAAAIVVDLGAGSRLVGSSQVWKTKPRELPSVVAALRPNLVVGPSTIPAALRDRVAEATGAPVYLVGDQTMSEIESTLVDLGLLTNRSVPARALIHADDAARERLARRLQGEPRVRVFVDTSFLSTDVSTRDLFSDLLRLAGGRNVAGPNPGPGLFSIAQLATLDPQVYLMTTPNKARAYLRARPRAKAIAAVRDDRFHLIPPAYLEPRARLGPRLTRLAELLHP